MWDNPHEGERHMTELHALEKTRPTVVFFFSVIYKNATIVTQ